MLYDKNGTIQAYEPFQNLINYNYHRDSATNAFYTVLNIPQTDYHGNKQYPFVYWENYPNGGIKSTLQMNASKGFFVAINAGRFQSPYGSGVTLTGLPCGTVIQNSVVLQQGTSSNSNALDKVLTIKNDGSLGYADCTDSATDLISAGVVSAVSGFVPIIVDYEDVFEVDDTVTYNDTSNSQRQVLGQYNNGDYVVISTEGRNNQGDGYFTVAQLKTLCKSLGVKDAFLLDGGGSMETVVGDKQLNPIYENAYGRVVPTYIVFNGTTSFTNYEI